jgi:hypothetical protein
MPRLSSASVGLVLSVSCWGLVGCDQGASSDVGPSAGAPSAGASTAGASSAGTSSGGAAGSASSAGTSGTGTGGAGTAGSAGAAGAAGAAGTGSGGGAGGGSGTCAGALFCDDFESYTGTPGAPWAVTKNSQGNVVIDGAQHKSGTKAFKFTTSGAATYQQSFITLAKPFPVANNAFYGRMMIYATKVANDGVHWTMIQGEGSVTTPAIERALVRYGGQHQQAMMANYDSNPVKSDCWKHSATKMPEGKWACMEWYFEGATNTQKFWLDGKAIDDLTVVEKGEGCVAHETEDKWLFPQFKKVSVGWESYQTDDAREVWIDDVALGTTQIGCPQ